MLKSIFHRFSTEVLDTTLSTFNNKTSKSPTVGTNNRQYYLIAYLLILIVVIIAFVVWKVRNMRRGFGHKGSILSDTLQFTKC